MVQFRLSEPGVMVYHNEPLIRDGKIVSYLSSGAYGHHLGRDRHGLCALQG